jgi:signal transduction histidine kinase
VAWALALPSWTAESSRVVAAAVFGALLPWLVGRSWRQSRELVWAGWERAERLQREQRLIAEQARLRERARIAQDMHDALGHELSLLALRAGALKVAPGLDPRHRAAAAEIRAGAAAAVERLGEVIGVLREESGGTAPPLPSGAGLAGLVERAADSGVAVELDVVGDPDGVPPMVAHAAFRVVQEALTNVAKHAPDAPTTVRVGYGTRETWVRVVNGPGAAPDGGAPSGGRGLIGLRERVRVVGGTLECGPGPDGGFAVCARLPHEKPPGSSGGPPEPAEAGELRHARRRVGRRLLVAVTLPLAVGAVLTGALQGWSVYATERSVLDPADFARLRPGQDRAAAERYLPDRQAPVRPPSGGPSGPGVDCAYYAMTSNPWHDRSGDLYRVCFRGGRVLSADALVAGDDALVEREAR